MTSKTNINSEGKEWCMLFIHYKNNNTHAKCMNNASTVVHWKKSTVLQRDLQRQMQYDGGHLKKLPSKFHERRLHIWPCAERRLHIWLAQWLLNSVTECKCPSTKKLQSQYFLHIPYTMTATEEWLETRTRQQAAEPTQPTQRGKRHRPSSRSIRPPFALRRVHDSEANRRAAAIATAVEVVFESFQSS